MKRRELIRSVLLSLALVSTISTSALGQPAAGGGYVEGQRITLGNQYLDWDLLMTEGTIRSTGVRNKLSGRYFELKDSREILLTFSGAKARVEIPWWNVELGADHDSTPPDRESGYRRGYHLETFQGDEEWDKMSNLLLRGGRRVVTPAVFKGYAWFRQWFELPQEAEGEPIVLCLGGYNQEDWNQYWTYVNGTLMGHWTGSGRWRTPKQLRVLPGSEEYRALRFGAGKKNLLAIRTYELDKRFEGVSDAVLDRFIFDGRFADQFIAVGQPYLFVSGFKLNRWRQENDGEGSKYVFELIHAQEQLEVKVHYELDEFLRRKWLEVKNLADRERLLLDVDVDDFRIQGSMSEGDYGYPVIVEEELFWAVEHPAGLSQGLGDRIRLRHFPGRKLAKGNSLTSKVSIAGVGPQGAGRQQFLDYIQSRSPRRKLLSIYDPLGINGFPDHPCWTLNDREMLESLDLLEKWQKQGVQFDYYVPDVGWQGRTGDLTRFLPECFPDGPRKVIERVNELGMNWGLWFASTWGDWSSGLNPEVNPSRTVPPGGKWPEHEYWNGFALIDGRRHLCLASEPYFSMLRDALLHHIRHYNLRFFKLDTGSYYCNSVSHPHLPGKYSTEAGFDAAIEIARVTRQAMPDVYLMWYWGIRSPFFALHGDSIFGKRLTMEAASSSDYPALFFRDTVTLALDQGTRFTEFIPPMNKDSLGIWITDTWWGNSMRKERWREAAVMDLGRGNLLFPQLWGDLYSFSSEDVAFLARIQKLAKQNETIFYRQKTILGDPWKNEIYGYAYFQGAPGFLFLNNVDFQSRRVRLKLDETIGLEAPAGMSLRLLEHFPGNVELRRNGQPLFKSGQTVATWLRPFEVAMWEVLPETQGAMPESLQPRELPEDHPDVESHRLALEPEAPAAGMEIRFADPDHQWVGFYRSAVHERSVEKLQQAGYRKRIIPRRAKIPPVSTKGHVLAVVLRLKENGKWWRQRQLANLIQMKATIGEQVIRLEAVPNFRQTQNNQWSPWLVFKTRMSAGWSGKDLRIAINAYLPPEVECQEEAWLVPQWWE